MPGPSPHNNDRQRVLDATDIVRLVGDHLTLKAKGREYVCVCPFHDDHKPSMYVVPQKQIYHCFSCGAGGNALDFVINYHKMDFLEALRFLADRSGVELSPPPRRERRAESSGDGQHDETAYDHDERASRAELAQANRFAADFFRTILRHPEHGAAARAIVERRAISPEMAELFEVGAAPDRWDGLLKTVEVKKLPTAWFAEGGLLKTREQGGGHYDTFRNRLIFPIHDQLGRPIAFGGRKINEEDEPKYLNSPETRLFDKGATLYGLHQAFRAIQNERVAIVTEGYMDVIACHQAGVKNVVATLGTALTPKHASILKRVCDAVVLFFDADEAGARATDRAMEVFFAEPIDVRIATLPEGKDPDELFKLDDGVARFRAAVDSARDAMDHRFRRLRQSLGQPGVSKLRIVEAEVQRLVELGLNRLSPPRRNYVIKRLSEVARIGQEAIQQAVDLAAQAAQRRSATRERYRALPDSDEHQTIQSEELSEHQSRERDVREDAETELLGAVLGDMSLAELPVDLGKFSEAGEFALLSKLDRSQLLVSAHRRILGAIQSVLTQSSDQHSMQAVLAMLEDGRDRSTAARLYAHVETILSTTDESHRRVIFERAFFAIRRAIFAEKYQLARLEMELEDSDMAKIDEMVRQRRRLDPNPQLLGDPGRQDIIVVNPPMDTELGPGEHSVDESGRRLAAG